MTILLADDEELILRLVEQTLTGDGHRVLTVRDSSEALAISRDYRGHIDLLLSDIRMPGMDGIDLSVAVRQHRPQIAVLLMDFDIPPGRAKPPFARFLQKPFTPSDLVAIVRRTFGPDANAAAAAFDGRRLQS